MKKRGMAALLVALLLFVTACGASQQPFEAGTVTEDAYRSTFFNLTFDLSENWDALDEDEIAEVTSAVQDMFSDTEDVKHVLDSGGTFYDLYAINQEEMQQVTIVVAKLQAADRVKMKTGGDKALLEDVANGLPDALAGTPMEDAQIALGETTFMGETVSCIDWYLEQMSEYGAYDSFQKQLMLVSGSYSMTITVTSYFEDTTQEILTRFHS